MTDHWIPNSTRQHPGEKRMMKIGTLINWEVVGKCVSLKLPNQFEFQGLSQVEKYKSEMERKL